MSAAQVQRDRRRPSRFRRLRPWQIVWPTLLWVLLWRDFSVFGVLGGVLVAVLVSLVFPLPPLRLHVRFRPIAFAWLTLRFHYDVAVASWQVTKATLRRRGITNAVVGVQLRTPSDFVLTIVGEMLTLVPGSVLVEAERETYTIYLHVFDVRTLEDVEAFRRDAWAQERRVVRAFGMHLDHLDLPPPEAQAHALARLAEKEDRK